MGKNLVEDYKNIMDCRTTKSNIIHSLPNIVKHFYFIKYEDLLKDPILFLELIKDKFSLVPKLVPFRNWIHYKDEKELYIKKPITIPPEIIEKFKNIYRNLV